MSEYLTQVEVDALPDGTRIHVVWFGGNSGHYITKPCRGVGGVAAYSAPSNGKGLFFVGSLDRVGTSRLDNRVRIDESLRVLVTGGRDFTDMELVTTTLDKLWIRHLYHGAANGADTLCATWAKLYGVPATAMPADWRKHGVAAGIIRNQAMLDKFKPDLLVAFPGGRGTADMVQRAQGAGVCVLFAGQPEPLVNPITALFGEGR